jgi:hypothetical protein
MPDAAVAVLRAIQGIVGLEGKRAVSPQGVAVGPNAEKRNPPVLRPGD